jgi:predicted transcriptional regulator
METVQYTLRIPVDLKTELEEIAQSQDRSLSKQIVFALRQHVRDIREEQSKPVD